MEVRESDASTLRPRAGPVETQSRDRRSVCNFLVQSVKERIYLEILSIKFKFCAIIRKDRNGVVNLIVHLVAVLLLKFLQINLLNKRRKLLLNLNLPHLS